MFSNNVHLNPVRARLLAPEAPLHTYLWSSYPHYLQRPSRRPPWLRVERLLGEWRVPVDRAAGRRQFAAQIEARRQGEADEEFKAVRHGWCLGGEKFRAQLLKQIDGMAAKVTTGKNWWNRLRRGRNG